MARGFIYPLQRMVVIVWSSPYSELTASKYIKEIRKRKYGCFFEMGRISLSINYIRNFQFNGADNADRNIDFVCSKLIFPHLCYLFCLSNARRIFLQNYVKSSLSFIPYKWSPHPSIFCSISTLYSFSRYTLHLGGRHKL